MFRPGRSRRKTPLLKPALRPRRLHDWNVTPSQAMEIQKKLAPRVIRSGAIANLRLAAGVDLAFSNDWTECIAGVVLWNVPEARVVEQHVARKRVSFPYVPGLLSFREAPALIAAIGKLRTEPDVFLFDGQGYAHPRRFGLACHVGLLLDRPSLGCAKSLLVGEYDELGETRGSTSPLVHNGERVGVTLRTRDGVNPVYVSAGHRITLASAVDVVLQCCLRYRLPEPTRLADILVAREKEAGR